MDAVLTSALLACETDLDGAIRRFSGDETLYTKCLTEFLEDTTMDSLNKAIAAEAWDHAFTAAHALKGLAGNMGFIPLYHAVAELVMMIRAGRLKEIEASNKEVCKRYREIFDAICTCCPAEPKGEAE